MEATVNFAALESILVDWLDTFNDCACCPCYPRDCAGIREDTKCLGKIESEYLKLRVN